MRRFVIWLLWSVGFGLVPYALALLFAFSNDKPLPTYYQLFGSGQLLLTSLALTGIALTDMFLRGGVSDTVARILLLSSGIASLLFICGEFGNISSDPSPSKASQDNLLLISALAFGAAVAQSFLATRLPEVRPPASVAKSPS